MEKDRAEMKDGASSHERPRHGQAVANHKRDEPASDKGGEYRYD